VVRDLSGASAARLTIVPLADRPELIPVVGRWHWDAWGHEDPIGSVETWTDGLRKRSGREAIPISWVALVDETPVGSVALVEHDMLTRRDFTPWLSGLFVLPEYRRAGIGRALIRHCEETASALGVRRLYLYTTTAETLYAQLGWRPLTRERYGSEEVLIMAKDLV
jgi:GNAT superfamily N-acetyltransferase